MKDQLDIFFQYPIDKNIPMPELRPIQNYAGGLGIHCKYPWANMEIGDSFFVPCKPEEKTSTVGVLGSSNLGWRKRNNMDIYFTVRREATGVRVWRIR